MGEDLVQLFNKARNMEAADDYPGALAIYNAILENWSDAEEQSVRDVVERLAGV